jgi:tetratricopeptide (TPR) repeat protein
MQDQNGARVVRVAKADAIAVAGGHYQPIRRQLGVRGFGINAYFASNAGDQLIEPHDETGSGSGGHAELYLVISGRARFVVGSSEIDAPPGTIVYIPDPETRREAHAAEGATSAVVVGCPADRELPISPFEFWFVAEGPYNEGDYERAIEIVTEGLEHWPEHPTMLYQLSCYHALAGRSEEAIGYFERAVARSPDLAEWARGDSDLDSIRDDPRFRELVGDENLG